MARLRDFLRVVPSVRQGMWARLFFFHMGALPTVLVGLIAMPIYLVRSLGVSGLGSPASPDAKEFKFFPDHILTEVALALFLMILLTFLAIVFPAGLDVKADPLVTPEHINFMARKAGGIICLSIVGERLDALNLPLMVRENTARHGTAFTVPVDVTRGARTGTSGVARAARTRRRAEVPR